MSLSSTGPNLIVDPRLAGGGWPYVDRLLDDYNSARTEDQRQITLHVLKLQHELMFPREAHHALSPES